MFSSRFLHLISIIISKFGYLERFLVGKLWLCILPDITFWDLSLRINFEVPKTATCNINATVQIVRVLTVSFGNNFKTSNIRQVTANTIQVLKVVLLISSRLGNFGLMSSISMPELKWTTSRTYFSGYLPDGKLSSRSSLRTWKRRLSVGL